jgi:hypothetical protein
MSELLIELFKRVASFQTEKWTYQHLELYNPYALASIGYLVKSINQLECHICHHTVIFPHKILETDEMYESLYDHDDHCLYKG